MFESIFLISSLVAIALAADAPEKIIDKAIENHEKKKMINEMYEEYKIQQRIKQKQDKVLNNPLTEEFCRLKGITIEEFLKDIEKTEREDK